jgi:hypothetical protein
VRKVIHRGRWMRPFHCFSSELGHEFANNVMFVSKHVRMEKATLEGGGGWQGESPIENGGITPLH